MLMPASHAQTHVYKVAADTVGSQNAAVLIMHCLPEDARSVSWPAVDPPVQEAHLSERGVIVVKQDLHSSQHLTPFLACAFLACTVFACTWVVLEHGAAQTVSNTTLQLATPPAAALTVPTAKYSSGGKVQL